MKQITEAEQLLNKTIERTAYIDNAFCLFFTDKTFCIFQGCGWDEKDVELLDEKFDIIPNGYNTMDLLNLGFITKDEADAVTKKYQDDNRQLVEQKEIEKLKELKAKYPNI